MAVVLNATSTDTAWRAGVSEVDCCCVYCTCTVDVDLVKAEISRIEYVEGQVREGDVCWRRGGVCVSEQNDSNVDKSLRGLRMCIV